MSHVLLYCLTPFIALHCSHPYFINNPNVDVTPLYFTHITTYTIHTHSSHSSDVLHSFITTMIHTHSTISPNSPFSTTPHAQYPVCTLALHPPHTHHKLQSCLKTIVTLHWRISSTSSIHPWQRVSKMYLWRGWSGFTLPHSVSLRTTNNCNKEALRKGRSANGDCIEYKVN